MSKSQERRLAAQRPELMWLRATCIDVLVEAVGKMRVLVHDSIKCSTAGLDRSCWEIIMFRKGDHAVVTQKIWSRSGLFVARPGETVRIEYAYDCPGGNQIVAVSKDGYGVSDIVCIPGSSPLRELNTSEAIV